MQMDRVSSKDMTWPACTIMHRQVSIHMGDVGQESQHEFGSEHECISACVCCAHKCVYTDVYTGRFTQFTLEKQY